MIKNKKNFDSGFSLKLSYFKFTKNPLYVGQTNLFITPSYSFNYKILKNRSLAFTSQVGLSAPIKYFSVSSSGNGFYSTQSEYIMGAIIKLGIQYSFKSK